MNTIKLTGYALVIALSEKEHRFSSPFGCLEKTLPRGILSKRLQEKPVSVTHRRDPVLSKNLVVQLLIVVERAMLMTYSIINRSLINL